MKYQALFFFENNEFEKIYFKMSSAAIETLKVNLKKLVNKIFWLPVHHEKKGPFGGDI